ncbi:MAG: 3-deoxy-7-phosphoheptulonate synthase [Defluviitaleaceae bacterium]|nr:3-deoxy-7-phosphoheptulonate synthase [Defluviitaleaceae bacterium]
MSFECIRQLPTVNEVRGSLPLSSVQVAEKNKREEQLARIISGEDDRLLVVIGPCSADDEDAVVEYATRLAAVQEKVEQALFIVPRVYVAKQRTAGVGYQGLLYQADSAAEPNVAQGIYQARKLYLRIFSETGLTTASELISGISIDYFSDLISYYAVGARSSEDQAYRQIASGIDVPVGIKNPMSGDIRVLLNSIYAAQQPHRFAYDRAEVETQGNPYAHAILRGFSDANWRDDVQSAHPNYHYDDLVAVIEKYKAMESANPMIVIDASHGNSGKLFYEQPRVIRETLANRKRDPQIREYVRGVMIESYLEEGACSAGEYVRGKSITDPCLGWEDTEKLLLYIADNV